MLLDCHRNNLPDLYLTELVLSEGLYDFPPAGDAGNLPSSIHRHSLEACLKRRRSAPAATVFAWKQRRCISDDVLL